ncbi:PIN domain nuclease [Candidatus Aerophobetes bacterium]|nr:PIN domain nuclease [Candidatus Aerophobetes bacterium]
MFLIDTSVWIFALGKNYLPQIREKVDRLLEKNEAAICAMIRVELLAGTRTKKEFERLKSRLNSLYEIEITGSVWEKAAEMAFSLRRKGITCPSTDILIGAAALSEHIRIVHADEHFSLIAKHINLLEESLIDMVNVSGSQV